MGKFLSIETRVTHHNLNGDKDAVTKTITLYNKVPLLDGSETIDLGEEGLLHLVIDDVIDSVNSFCYSHGLGDNLIDIEMRLWGYEKYWIVFTLDYCITDEIEQMIDTQVVRYFGTNNNVKWKLVDYLSAAKLQPQTIDAKDMQRQIDELRAEIKTLRATKLDRHLPNSGCESTGIYQGWNSTYPGLVTGGTVFQSGSAG